MANKRRKIAKKQSIKQMQQRQYNKLLNETNQQIQKTNKRLRNLSKAGYQSGTWASKNLMERLKSSDIEKSKKKKRTSTKKKLVQIKLKNKKATKTDLKRLQKATMQFLRSKTSTARGIQETSRNVKKGMLKAMKKDGLKPNEKEVTMEEMDFYYSMFGNNDFDYFVEQMHASDVWQLIDEAIEQHQSKDSFVNKLLNYLDHTPDLDERERAKRLYDKYVIF